MNKQTGGHRHDEPPPAKNPRPQNVALDDELLDKVSGGTDEYPDLLKPIRIQRHEKDEPRKEQ